MAQIDPIYFLTPIAVFALCGGVVGYWRWKRQFTGAALGAALLAYGGAILAKVLLQAATLGPFESATGGNPVLLGIYDGSQTAVFEVGGAFLVAGLVVGHGLLTVQDAETFGIGLGVWEDAALIALPLLVEYLVYYTLLANPGTPAAHGLTTELMQGAPALFYGPGAAAPLLGAAILERLSSLLAHSAWGFLAVLAVVHRRRWYFAVAAPVGFAADFLMPFAGQLGLGPFEGIEFALTVLGVVLALFVTRDLRRARLTPPGEPSTSGRSVPASPVTYGSPESPRLNTCIAAIANAAAPAATASTANQLTTGKTIVTPRSSGASGPAIAAPAPATA
jgi:YhfC intramembrane metalloprotease